MTIATTKRRQPASAASSCSQASGIKETPILFSAAMVNAILAGRKTVTRRVIKLPQWAIGRDIEIDEYGIACCFDGEQNTEAWLRCPFADIKPTWSDGMTVNYQPGRRLWVRETWAHERCFDHLAPTSIPVSAHDIGRILYGNKIIHGWHKKRTSIHMPRWASRITLEVTGVRVERLQDISGADAKAEGVDPIPFSNGTTEAIWEPGYGVEGQDSYTPAFQQLWGRINGPESWDANPYVWVVWFKRI